MEKLQLISALTWYLEAKNLSIINACSLRCPLSASDAQNLRIYYSQYFINLLAITELLAKDYKGADGKANERYKIILHKQLDFCENNTGKKNYDYLRELRNSIIHRGLDITSQATINDDGHILVYAPLYCFNQDGTKKYKTFDTLLSNIIIKVDERIRLSVLKHLSAESIFDIGITTDKLRIDAKDKILANPNIPSYVKEMANSSINALTEDQMLEIKNGNSIKVKKLLEEEIIQFM